MRRILPALTIVAALFVLAPAANAAVSTTQRLTGVTVGPATDGIDERNTMDLQFQQAGERGPNDDLDCVPWAVQYRAVGATDAAGAGWRAPHYYRTRFNVELDGVWGAAYGAKRVEFRIDPGCSSDPTVIVRTIQYLKPHTLDPKLEKVTVPSTVTGDTVSVAIIAKSGGYAQPKDLRVLFATEDGTWVGAGGGSQQGTPYQPVMTAPVSAGLGAKGLFVRVVDGYRDSNTYYVRFTRTKAAPPTAPSNNAPTLTAIATPAKVAGSTVQVTIKATDDNGVKRVRFATEAGSWGAWQAWNPKTNVYAAPVSSGLGYKGVFVQVQDSGYATSSILYRKFTRVASL